MGIITIGLIVLNVVALWKLFEKAGDQGWKSLIPYFNTWTCCKLADRKQLFVVYLVLSILSNAILTVLYIEGIILTIKAVELDESSSTLKQISSAFQLSEPVFITIMLLLVVAVIALTVIRIMINVSFVKRYCNETSVKVIAGIGSVKMLFILQVISRCIIAFNDEYVYHDPRVEIEWDQEQYTYNTYNRD